METPWALLVHDQDEPMGALRSALEGQAIQTCQARSRRAAVDRLNNDNPPRVVFTDEMLPDGTWADIVSTAASAHKPVNVIVVGHRFDLRLYAEAIQCGAFDFIAPPLVESDLGFVARCAMGNALARQNAQPADT